MIQIDMPMPKCCDECFALDEHGDYPFCLISQDQRGYTFNTRDRRMPTCPLIAQVPVKPKKVNRYIDFDGEGHPYNPETYDCGACGKELPWKANYCPECGREVKWE